jgi:hypothetical protein
VIPAALLLGMNHGWKRMAEIQVPIDAERHGLRPPSSPRMSKIQASFDMHLLPPAVSTA